MFLWLLDPFKIELFGDLPSGEDEGILLLDA